MSKKNTMIFVSFLIIVSVVAGFLIYPQLSEVTVSHWDGDGNPNGYMNRFWQVALMPLMIAGLSALLLFLPNIDPLKENITQFQQEYHNFVAAFGLFLLYTHGLSLAWNLGYKFNLSSLLLPGLGIFLFFMGGMLEKARRNFFIGIRTPWTLSSDTVWNQTHQLGGKLLKASGLLALGGFIFPRLAGFFLLIPLLGSSLFLTAYSYYLFRMESEPNG